MKRILAVAGILGWAMLCVDNGGATYAQSPPVPTTTPRPMNVATGTFEVTLTPQTPDETLGDTSLGSLLIDKQFFGDLQAKSKGQMLTALTATEGSAGYVAVEHVSGTLHGRVGTFALQHTGTMTRGAPELKVSVVPDSGTDGLVGISGEMTITISEGTHLYEFAYTLDSDL